MTPPFETRALKTDSIKSQNVLLLEHMRDQVALMREQNLKQFEQNELTKSTNRLSLKVLRWASASAIGSMCVFFACIVLLIRQNQNMNLQDEMVEKQVATQKKQETLATEFEERLKEKIAEVQTVVEEDKADEMTIVPELDPKKAKTAPLKIRHIRRVPVKAGALPKKVVTEVPLPSSALDKATVEVKDGKLTQKKMRSPKKK